MSDEYHHKPAVIKDVMRTLAPNPNALETGESCAFCGSDKVKPEDFRDSLSQKEFRISRLCMKCQDDVFGKC